MKINLAFAVFLGFMFTLFLMGKVYAQSTYPKVASIDELNPIPETEYSDVSPKPESKSSIWVKH